MRILLGIFYHTIGGAASGSFYMPYNKVYVLSQKPQEGLFLHLYRYKHNHLYVAVHA